MFPIHMVLFCMIQIAHCQAILANGGRSGRRQPMRRSRTLPLRLAGRVRSLHNTSQRDIYFLSLPRGNRPDLYFSQQTP